MKTKYPKMVARNRRSEKKELLMCNSSKILKINRFKSGAVYEGEWINNSRDGFGI
jgi:hypothetical protein